LIGWYEAVKKKKMPDMPAKDFILTDAEGIKPL
jgi:hypothetical protein